MPRYDSSGPGRRPLPLDEQTLAFKATIVLGVIAVGFGLLSCMPLLAGGEPALLWLGVAFLFAGAASLAYSIDAIETGTIITETDTFDKARSRGWYRFYVLFIVGGSVLFFLMGSLSIYMALTPAN